MFPIKTGKGPPFNRVRRGCQGDACSGFSLPSGRVSATTGALRRGGSGFMSGVGGRMAPGLAELPAAMAMFTAVCSGFAATFVSASAVVPTLCNAANSTFGAVSSAAGSSSAATLVFSSESFEGGGECRRISTRAPHAPLAPARALILTDEISRVL